MRSDPTSIEIKLMCYQCVGEKYLSVQIEKQGKRRKCSYCGKVRNCYTIGTLADIIDAAFSQHYERTSSDPSSLQMALIADKEADYTWERVGDLSQDAIRNAGDFLEKGAFDIQQVLEERYGDRHADEIGEETEFSSESCYQEKDVNDSSWQNDWVRIERTLKTESRFFNRTVSNHLKLVFKDLSALQSAENAVIADAGPRTKVSTLYRARVFQSDKKLQDALVDPDEQLGPPPSLLSTPGRMNAQGISVFYGAFTPDVALSEVRPPVGSKVIVTKFNIVRQIKLLDLSALGNLIVEGSIFDSTYAARLERAMF